MGRVSRRFCLLVSLISASAAISWASGGDEMLFREKRQADAVPYFFYQQPQYPRDCEEVYDQCEGQSADGVYLIKPDDSSEPFEVYCNNSIDDGSWTVLQRRVDGSVNFYRNWSDYKNGFGFLRGEFWLGNDKISYLTNQKIYELRIDLNNVNGEPYFAKYNLFQISDEGSKYRLVGLGEYNSSSTASENMAANRNYAFSTPDRENDNSLDRHCGAHCKSGWWFGGTDNKSSCGSALLNNLYTEDDTICNSIRWFDLPGGNTNLKYTEMKSYQINENNFKGLTPPRVSNEQISALKSLEKNCYSFQRPFAGK